MSRLQPSPSRAQSLVGNKIFYCKFIVNSLRVTGSLIELIFCFSSETNTVNTGLLVEVWTKGMILDRVLGYQYITLDTLPYNQYDDPANYEQWYSIDTEQVMMNGEVNGTRDPTGHMLLLNLHFELPFGEFIKRLKYS